MLILREVLRWKGDEVAELLDTTVASVNSALQRALLDRYLDAFERYDIDTLVTLLRDDVVQSMPPFELWLRGPDQVKAFMLGQGAACRHSRVVPAPGEPYLPWALHVLEISDGVIVGLNFFLDTDTLFPIFGLPPHLDP